MTKLNEEIKEIMSHLQLVLNPQAVKMIEKPEDIPAEAQPASEIAGHMAYCQAQALTKRQGQTIYMEKKDHWCWAALVGFGMVDFDPQGAAYDVVARYLGVEKLDDAREFLSSFPMLPNGKYIGTVVGPAQSVSYDPDVVLINCDNNFQLRALIWAIKYKTGKLLDVSLDAIDSCVRTIVTSMLTGEYTVAIPDLGEQMRALPEKNEIILGVPAARIPELLDGLRGIAAMQVGYRDVHPFMEYDHVRPPFYDELYDLWNLDH